MLYKGSIRAKRNCISGAPLKQWKMGNWVVAAVPVATAMAMAMAMAIEMILAMEMRMMMATKAVLLWLR